MPRSLASFLAARNALLQKAAEERGKRCIHNMRVRTHSHRVDYVVRVNGVLGEGLNSKVLPCYSIATGQEYAMKILRDNLESRAELEIQLLLGFKSQVAQIHSLYSNVIEGYPKLVVVMDCIQGEDLMDRIMQRDKRPLSERRVAEVMRQLLTAVSDLHTLGVAFRDLRPEKIMFTSRSDAAHIRLVDFDCARLCPATSSTTTTTSEEARGNGAAAAEETKADDVIGKIVTQDEKPEEAKETGPAAAGGTKMTGARNTAAAGTVENKPMTAWKTVIEAKNLPEEAKTPGPPRTVEKKIHTAGNVVIAGSVVIGATKPEQAEIREAAEARESTAAVHSAGETLTEERNPEEANKPEPTEAGERKPNAGGKTAKQGKNPAVDEGTGNKVGGPGHLSHLLPRAEARERPDLARNKEDTVTTGVSVVEENTRPEETKKTGSLAGAGKDKVSADRETVAQALQAEEASRTTDTPAAEGSRGDSAGQAVEAIAKPSVENQDGSADKIEKSGAQPLKSQHGEVCSVEAISRRQDPEGGGMKPTARKRAKKSAKSSKKEKKGDGKESKDGASHEELDEAAAAQPNATSYRQPSVEDSNNGPATPSDRKEARTRKPKREKSRQDSHASATPQRRRGWQPRCWLRNREERRERKRLKAVRERRAQEALAAPSDRPLYTLMLRYAIAEQFADNGYGRSLDAWSLGYVAFVMIAGYSPYSRAGERQPLGRSKQRGRCQDCTFVYPAGEWLHVSRDALQFVRSLLERDVRKRSTVDDALKHSWLRSVAPDRGEPLVPRKVTTASLEDRLGEKLNREATQLLHKTGNDFDMIYFYRLVDAEPGSRATKRMGLPINNPMMARRRAKQAKTKLKAAVLHFPEESEVADTPLVDLPTALAPVRTLGCPAGKVLPPVRQVGGPGKVLPPVRQVGGPGKVLPPVRQVGGPGKVLPPVRQVGGPGKVLPQVGGPGQVLPPVRQVGGPGKVLPQVGGPGQVLPPVRQVGGPGIEGVASGSSGTATVDHTRLG